MSASTQPDFASKQIENIYLTSKIRMTSEVRLKLTGKLLNALITWYSFVLIALSVADIAKIIEFKYFSTFSVAYSVGTLVASLILQGERHQERAERFRECYLKLQGIYRSTALTDEEKLQDYQKILDNYENHSDYDYQSVVVSSWWNSKTLENLSGKLKPSLQNFFYIGFRKVLSFFFWASLFLLPIFSVTMLK